MKIIITTTKATNEESNEIKWKMIVYIYDLDKLIENLFFNYIFMLNVHVLQIKH